jgi:hypothetical protein
LEFAYSVRPRLGSIHDLASVSCDSVRHEGPARRMSESLIRAIIGSPESNPGTQSVRPWVKSTLGRQAKLRAVTRVNPEQAPKVQMWMPILPNRGEGRCASGKNRSEHRLWSTGVVGTARNECLLGNVGDSLWEAGRDCRRRHGRRPWRVSERPMVPVKPLTTVEGRGLTSGCL